MGGKVKSFATKQLVQMVDGGLAMVIGGRLKLLREQKNMSQGDIQKRTGLLRCYISRVENGHTVPGVDTLERMARALGVPMYRLFTDDAVVRRPNIAAQKKPSRAASKEHERYLRALAKLLSRMCKRNRVLLLHMASKMANKREGRLVEVMQK